MDTGMLVAIAGTTMTAHHIRPGFMGTVTIDRTHTILVVTVCGILGSFIESVTGTYIKTVPNSVMNFLNTAAGAVLFWIAWHFAPLQVEVVSASARPVARPNPQPRIAPFP